MLPGVPTDPLALNPDDDAFPAALPPGLTARRPALPADAAAVIELVRSIDARYVGRPSQPAEQVVADLEESGDDLAIDAWVVTAGDRIVGVGWFVVENPEPPRPGPWFAVYARPAVMRRAARAPRSPAGGGRGPAGAGTLPGRPRRWPRPGGV